MLFLLVHMREEYRFKDTGGSRDTHESGHTNLTNQHRYSSVRVPCEWIQLTFSRSSIAANSQNRRKEPFSAFHG